MSESAEIYLLIGGNLGKRWENIEDTCRLIGKHIGTILERSSVYETEPWGVSDQPWFLNQVIKAETILSPEELLNVTKKIEDILQSKKLRQWGERAADVDILFYEDKVVEKDHLKIPHPQMQNRKFVLIPLNEIAPEKFHPILQQSVAEMLLKCSDTLEVKKAVKHEI